MKALGTILVPVDFSSCTDAVLAVACDISRRYRAPIELLHAWKPASYILPETDTSFIKDDIQRITHKLERALAERATAARAHGAIAVQVHVEPSYAVSAIVTRAKALNCGLIVMGTHGRVGIRRLLMGSIAEKVMRMAPCPVLTVHSKLSGDLAWPTSRRDDVALRRSANAE